MTKEEALNTLKYYGQSIHARQSMDDGFNMACYNGHRPLAEAYLALGADPNSRFGENDKTTALMTALREEDHDIVEWLLSLGVDLEVEDADGRRALSYATDSNNPKAVQLLLQAGANPNVWSSTKKSPIINALVRGKEVYALLKDHADPNAFHQLGESFLQYCITYERKDGLQDAFTTFKVKADPTLTDANGENLLVFAVTRADCNLGIINVLLENGVDPNVTDRHGWAIRYAAAMMGHDAAPLLAKKTDESIGKAKWALLDAAKRGDIVDLRLCLTGDTTINTLDYNGNTVLQKGLLAEVWNQDHVDALIGMGVDLNHRNDFGVSALDIVYESENFELAHHLIQKGANPNNPQGLCEPLDQLLAYGNLEEFEVLLTHGANLQDLRHLMRTICDANAGSKSLIIKAIELLAQHGANLSIRDEATTLLCELCSANASLDIIQALVKHGSDIHLQDQHGNSPIFNTQNEWVFSFLLKSGASFDQFNHLGQNIAAYVGESRSDGSHMLPTLRKFLWTKVEDLAKKHNITNWNNLPPAFVTELVAMQCQGTLMAWIYLHREKPNSEIKKIIQLSIENGVPVEQVPGQCYSPLSLAVAAQDLTLTQWLLAAGANPNGIGPKPENTLARLFPQKDPGDNYLPLMRLLLEHGANPNELGEYAWSPLHAALSKGRIDAAELLLQFGADFSLVSDLILPDLATCSPAVVQWAIDHGADIAARNRLGNNILAEAVLKKNKALIPFLLSLGIPLDDPNFKGRTPRAMIMDNGFGEFLAA